MTKAEIHPAQGLASIELTYTQPGGSDTMTSDDLIGAAFNLLWRCVQPHDSGGILKGLGVSTWYHYILIRADLELGFNGNLQMTIQENQPQWECDKATPKYPKEKACLSVLGSIPAGLEHLEFGSFGTPGIDTGLPLIFATRQSCNSVK